MYKDAKNQTQSLHLLTLVNTIVQLNINFPPSTVQPDKTDRKKLLK